MTDTYVWRRDDVVTVWRHGRPQDILQVTRVAKGVVHTTDGSKWSTSGKPLSAARLGTTLAHTLPTDAHFVAKARLVARVRELIAYAFQEDRPYKVDDSVLVELERLLTRANAQIFRANYRNVESLRVDTLTADWLEQRAADLRRAEDLEILARWRAEKGAS